MGTDPLEARPTLRAWLDEYADIEAEFLDQLAGWGISAGERDAMAEAERVARERLRAKGRVSATEAPAS